MKAIVLALSMISACFLLLTANASAQATRTWVSGLGDDANPCSRTAPCKTFPGAYSRTAAGGEINCIDAGGFGTIAIGHSITIKCDNVEAGVISPSTTGITVNAGPTDAVYISGLDIEGVPGSLPGSVNGIKFNSGGELHIANCVIRGSNSAGPDGNGIFMANSNNAKMFVVDTIINGNTWTGIQVAPIMGANANVLISNVRSDKNGAGYLATTAAGGGAIWMDIENSTASGNLGAGVNSTGATSRVILNRVTSSVNNTHGLVVNGGGTIWFGYSTIFGNNFGLTQNSGTLNSYGNNLIDGNSNAGATPTVVPMH